MKTSINTIKEMIRFKEWHLFLRTFIISFKIFFLCLLRKDHLLFSRLPKKRDTIPSDDVKDRIMRYVNLCMFLRKNVGMNNTCFVYSVLLCHMLRQAGFDARVNFGAKSIEIAKEDDIPFVGHCWLSIGNEKVNVPHQLLLKYP
ncbi:MAG: lasso peptide biosynthesis protein [Candidatus Omnitrophica bacterium]|nr:lasso peptide biosynthesis protein [Candidatus Omnitrophota bacterium]